MTIVEELITDTSNGVSVANLDSVGDNTSICVADYKENFDWLWNLGESEQPSSGFKHWLETRKGQDATVIIAWEAAPESGTQEIRILRHVTPLDWALSISDDLLKLKPEDFPQLRIIIVDGYSSKFQDSGSGGFRGCGVFAVDMQDSIKAAMPWLQVMPRAGIATCRALMESLASDPDNFQHLKDVGAGHRNQVQSLNYAWQAMTASTDEGHSINNVVGPLLLLGDPVLAGRPLVGALLTEHAPWIDWKDGDWKKKLERLGGGKTKLKLLVLDDQWQDGWGEVICKAVGVEFDSTAKDQANRFIAIGSKKVSGNVIQVKACGTADWLFDIGKPLSSTSDQRFKLQLDDGREYWQEILFLDLRLFSSKSVEEEAKFIGTLVECAKQIQNREKGKLPWSGFEEDELKRIEAWVEGKKHDRKDSSYHEALTLLPRIISLLDLSYPVIFFSSTGRREIVESFKEHSNIITDFDKPRLTGVLADDVASQSASNFVRGFDSATNMLLTRIICKELSAVPLGSFDRTGNDESNRYTYVELYVDESGGNANKFFVGGCYAVFTGVSALKARKKADAFDDALVESGIRYFDAFGVGPTPCRIKKKKQTVESELLSAMGADENKQCKPICLGWLRITSDPYRDSKIEGDILDPKSIDNLFRLSLSSLIEIFLFETVPEIMNDSSENGIEVSVFAGTRVKFLSGKDKKTNKKCHSDNFRFGIDSIKTRKGDYLQFSVSREAVYPIVSDALSSHDKGIRIHRAVGIKLPYKGEKPTEFPEIFLCRKCGEMTQIRARDDVEKGKLKSPLICTACGNSVNLRPDYRALHYLADEILSNFPSEDKSSIYDSAFSTYSAPGQFDDILNEDLQRLLLVSRALDRGDIASAIVDIASVNVLQYDGAHTAYKLVSRRASSMLNHLDGTDFMEVCTRLPAVMFEHPFYSIIVQEKTAHKGYKYFVGVLQEGPYKGKYVFIPDRFSKLRRLSSDESLKVRYSEKDGKLRANELRLT